jgi:hypothetical protein
LEVAAAGLPLSEWCGGRLGVPTAAGLPHSKGLKPAYATPVTARLKPCPYEKAGSSGTQRPRNDFSATPEEVLLGLHFDGPGGVVFA